MILIVVGCAIVVAAVWAVFRSDKSMRHIWTELRYDMNYNVLGTRALIEDLVQKSKNKTELINKSGKVAVITGGTRGIGVEVVRLLMQCDIQVIMGCRKPQAAENVLKYVRSAGVVTGSLKAYELDTSSLESVRQFAKIINETLPCINYLINNAGIMYVPYAESVDGFESQFATNYLGHFLLTHSLLDLVIKGGNDKENARIVNVSSCAYITGDIDFEDINKKNLYVPFEAYSQSKLAQVLFTKHLNQLLVSNKKAVQVHSVHPGIVNTDLFDDTQLKKFGGWLMPFLFKTAEQGAFPIVHSCISPELENNGGSYISNCQVQKEDKLVDDKKLQERLFTQTMKWVNISNFGNLSI